MWDAIWNAINSPAIIAVIIAGVAWLITKYVTGKPVWEAWAGTIISAIRWAEKEIPDDEENAGLQRADAALKWAIDVYEKATGKTATPEVKLSFKQGIAITHDEIEPILAAKKSGDFPSGMTFTMLLIGLILTMTIGCSPSIDRASAAGRLTISHAMDNFKAVFADLETADELREAKVLDLVYSDFYGADGKPALLTAEQLAAKRKALPVVIAGLQELREKRKAQFAAAILPLQQADRQFANITAVNQAWWRFGSDPNTQALLNTVLDRLEAIEVKK